MLWCAIPKDLLPPWRDSAGLFRMYEDIGSLNSTTLVILDSPSTLACPILWRLSDIGITLVKLFKGMITTSSPVDGVISTAGTPDCHLWVFFTSPL